MSSSTFCTNCGEEISQTADFCSACGKKNGESESVESEPINNNQSKEQISKPDSTVTWLGVGVPEPLSYILIWVGPILILTIGISVSTAYGILGRIIGMIGLYVNAQYMIQKNNDWEPRSRAYLIGFLLLQIVAAPIYIIQHWRHS